MLGSIVTIDSKVFHNGLACLAKLKYGFLFVNKNLLKMLETKTIYFS